jgi:hypothetical protein
MKTKATFRDLTRGGLKRVTPLAYLDNLRAEQNRRAASNDRNSRGASDQFLYSGSSVVKLVSSVTVDHLFLVRVQAEEPKFLLGGRLTELCV